jgi:uncharacterized protein YbcI
MGENRHRPSDSATLMPDGPDSRIRKTELELANAVVSIYKERFGRGPTRARAMWAGSDLLVCTLEDSYTLADRKLVAMGEDQRLRENRLFVQHAASGDLIATVEHLTGRTVRAYVTGMDTRADVASELFYLEPGQHDGEG